MHRRKAPATSRSSIQRWITRGAGRTVQRPVAARFGIRRLPVGSRKKIGCVRHPANNAAAWGCRFALFLGRGESRPPREFNHQITKSPDRQITKWSPARPHYQACDLLHRKFAAALQSPQARDVAGMFQEILEDLRSARLSRCIDPLIHFARQLVIDRVADAANDSSVPVVALSASDELRGFHVGQHGAAAIVQGTLGARRGDQRGRAGETALGRRLACGPPQLKPRVIDDAGNPSSFTSRDAVNKPRRQSGKYNGAAGFDMLAPRPAFDAARAWPADIDPHAHAQPRQMTPQRRMLECQRAHDDEIANSGITDIAHAAYAIASARSSPRRAPITTAGRDLAVPRA